MRIIKKEFNPEFDQLLVTVEIKNKQYDIIIDNHSNYSQEKYQFEISEYNNDDIHANILEQFENSDFYCELCDFAKSEAIARDDKLEQDIVDKIEKNYQKYKEDDHFYSNVKLTILKHKIKDDFILRVERLENNSLEQFFYEILISDFDQDNDEVSLNEFCELSYLNQVHCCSQLN